MRSAPFPYMPLVIEKTPNGEVGYDIFSRLLKDRIVFIGTAIDDHVANVVIAQLLFLNSQDDKSDIYMYINSPGGIVTSGLAIYDTMQYIKPAISTVCVGDASSMAAFLLAAGTKGKRMALPNSRVMIHQPWGGTTGSVSDLEIQTEEIRRLKTLLNDVLSKNTGQPVDKVAKDTDRDRFLTAQQAVDYGIVDSILVKK